MGSQQLETVLSLLRQAGFAAEPAYPGQAIPRISSAVAAVHLEKVDSVTPAVTVEVCILCPQSLGGSACEAEALKAAEALSHSGFACIQDGCVYDRISQIYSVSIHASFSSPPQVSAPAFSAYENGTLQVFAVSFREAEDTGCQPVYATAEASPIGAGMGSRRWELVLEDQIPPGTKEPALSGGTFSLVVKSGGGSRAYSGCHWTSVTREYTENGLRRIRTGFAMRREEDIHG